MAWTSLTQSFSDTGKSANEATDPDLAEMAPEVLGKRETAGFGSAIHGIDRRGDSGGAEGAP